MNHSTRRHRLKKLLRLYAEFLPFCQTVEDSGRLAGEISRLRSEIEDIGLMTGSRLLEEFRTVGVVIESGMKHLTEFECKK